MLSKLNHIKKTVLSCKDILKCTADDTHDIAVMLRSNGEYRKLGIFSLKGKSAEIKVDFPDGSYVNHINGREVNVKNGLVFCCGDPVVIACGV